MQLSCNAVSSNGVTTFALSAPVAALRRRRVRSRKEAEKDGMDHNTRKWKLDDFREGLSTRPYAPTSSGAPMTSLGRSTSRDEENAEEWSTIKLAACSGHREQAGRFKEVLRHRCDDGRGPRRRVALRYGADGGWWNVTLDGTGLLHPQLRRRRKRFPIRKYRRMDCARAALELSGVAT